MELQNFTRKQLYDLVWKEPIQIIAPKFGLSDRGLAKLCERHAIPTPPRGYWAKKQAGHEVAKAPLIELEGARVKDTHAITKFVSPAEAPSGDNADEIDPLLAFWRAQRDELGEIRVTQTLASPHAIVAGWVKEDKQHRQTRSSWGASLPAAPRATSIERRRLRILSALYRALEQRGVNVHCARNSRDVEFRHERDATSFNIYEYTKQTRRPLTEAERAERWNEGATFKQEYVATGFLRGKIPVYLPRGIPVSWTEVDGKPFETIVGEVAATILTALAYRKAERERYEEEARIRWNREQAIKAEEARRQTLHGLAGNWRRASELRAYVEAVKAAARAGRLVIEEPALSEWSAWALTYASALDPIESGIAIRTESSST